MKIVLMPGLDKKNSDWLAHAECSLLPDFRQKQAIRYAHWEEKNVTLNPKRELQRLVRQCGNGSNTLLIAKSIGILLALVANCNRTFRPDAAIFLGTPVSQNHIGFLNADFSDLVAKTDFPILFIQQLSDRFCSYRRLKTILARCPKWNILIEPITGEDHLYDQFDEIGTLASGWHDSFSKMQGNRQNGRTADNPLCSA